MTVAMQAELQARYDYDPETGVFTRRFSHGRWKAGEPVGAIDSSSAYGYMQIYFRGRNWRVHQLAWLHVHGYVPVGVDHKDGDGRNNRLGNLREATQAENGQNHGVQRNNTTGHPGVYRVRNKRFSASIVAYGKKHSLGSFGSVDEAGAAYRAAKAALHSFHPTIRGL